MAIVRGTTGTMQGLLSGCIPATPTKPQQENAGKRVSITGKYRGYVDSYVGYLRDLQGSW